MQHMLNLNPLLGKIKGRRTICKTPMLYRAMCRHIGTIDYWDINNEYKHDTAQKGNSAQLAALLRNLEAEIAIVLDFATGGFSLIMKSFLTTSISLFYWQAVLNYSCHPEIFFWWSCSTLSQGLYSVPVSQVYLGQ